MTTGYRLDPVRSARERAEHGGKLVLTDAVSTARATADEVARAEGLVTAARARLALAMPASASAGAYVLADAYLARCRRGVAAARADEVRARASHAGSLQAVDLSRAQLAVLRADREVIERHFARWREQQRKQAELRAE